jgi:histone deacetylase 1/2
VQFIKSFNLPLLLLGGGGYTMRNVSRAWAYETGLAAGVKLGKRESFPMLFSLPSLLLDVYRTGHTNDVDSKEIPLNEYFEYFGPTYELDVQASNMDDLNSREYLDRMKRIVLENLRQTGGPPSVALQRKPIASHFLRLGYAERKE